MIGFLVACLFTYSAGCQYVQATNRTVLESSNCKVDNEKFKESCQTHAAQNLYLPGDNFQSHSQNTQKFTSISHLTPSQNAHFLLSPPKKDSTFPEPYHFLFAFLPTVFVSAHSISHPEPHSSQFDFAQVFYFIFCSIELTKVSLIIELPHLLI